MTDTEPVAWPAESAVRALVEWPGPAWSDTNSTVLLDYLRGALATIDALRSEARATPGLREAAEEFLRRWDDPERYHRPPAVDSLRAALAADSDVKQ